MQTHSVLRNAQFRQFPYFSPPMAFPPDLSTSELPIQEIAPAIRKHFLTENTLILSAPPGAGKSTLLPLLLLNEPWLAGKKIIMLEPRRLAASSIAHHMASLLGEKTGETVGYRIRFETQVSQKTRIEVVTEGILTRILHADNALEDVGLVIFDEFHERRVHTELSLLLCRETQEVLRPDLRLLVMSATMDGARLAGLLHTSALESKGRVFPVDLIYAQADANPYDLAGDCARTILQAARAQDGDILGFLPGEAEIRKCAALLEHSTMFVVHPLYGRLSHREQREAISPDPAGRRKVVLATAIAETSLTIGGIKIVVDTGYTRTHVFDPASGLSRLKTVRVSVDMADQRAGRAGRLSAGTCYRMWTSATQHQLAPYRTPEIIEADLAPTILDLAQWGVDDIAALPWLTPPPAGRIAQAVETLESIGAMREHKITEHGKLINRLPCHPRIAHMLVSSQSMPTWASLATDIAALLDERDPLDQVGSADIDLRIDALRKHRSQRPAGKRFDNIERIARSYRKLIGAKEDNHHTVGKLSGRLLAYAYPAQIAQLQPGRNGLFKLSNGRTAQLEPSDPLASEPWITAALLDARGGAGRIFLGAAMDEADLADFAIKESVINWDSQRREIHAATVTRVGCLRLEQRALANPDPEKMLQAWYQGLREDGRRLLNFDVQAVQLQNRILSIRTWHPDTGWPDVSTPALLEHPEAWFAPYLGTVKKTDQLKQLNINEIIYHALSYEQQQVLENLAPSHLAVPSGSRIRIQYAADGTPPVLAVRLQELFGLRQTPRVDGGKTALVIHLLSPGYKPVQVTTDLESFWGSTYFEVRKELKRRYPKHSWPDDPLEAPALRGVPRRRPE